MFKKMEAGDKETLDLWKKVTEWAYKGWEVTYSNENVDFDVCEYQSNFTKAGKEIIEIAIKNGIAEKDPSGAVIARLEKYGIPDKVLLRSDGTPIYITQDIQMAKDNFEKYDYEKRIYVVDKRQSDYFKQLFKLLGLLGFKWAGKLFHLAYGWISLPEGAMSSRAGTVVNADDVFDKLLVIEKEEIKNSLKDISDLENTGKKVALAAYRYGMLKIDAKQDIVFDLSSVTRFEGNTGPYLMYTYARALSILEKSGMEIDKESLSFEMFEDTPLNEKERALLREMYKFPESVALSAESITPHLLCNYLYDFAQKFNSFYGDVPVLNSKDGLKDFRLLLVHCSGQIIKNGLNLLGINVVEKM
jgi:arginyl-tRNA synthetase